MKHHTTDEFVPTTPAQRLAFRIEAQLAAGVRHVLFFGPELDEILKGLHALSKT